MSCPKTLLPPREHAHVCIPKTTLPETRFPRSPQRDLNSWTRNHCPALLPFAPGSPGWLKDTRPGDWVFCTVRPFTIPLEGIVSRCPASFRDAPTQFACLPLRGRVQPNPGVSFLSTGVSSARKRAHSSPSHWGNQPLERQAALSPGANSSFFLSVCVCFSSHVCPEVRCAYAVQTTRGGKRVG